MTRLESHALNVTLSNIGSSEKFCKGGIPFPFLEKITVASVWKISPTKDKSRSGEVIQEATPVTQGELTKVEVRPARRDQIPDIKQGTCCGIY